MKTCDDPKSLDNTASVFFGKLSENLKKNECKFFSLFLELVFFLINPFSVSHKNKNVTQAIYVNLTFTV